MYLRDSLYAGAVLSVAVPVGKKHKLDAWAVSDRRGSVSGDLLWDMVRGGKEL